MIFSKGIVHVTRAGQLITRTATKLNASLNVPKISRSTAGYCTAPPPVVAANSQAQLPSEGDVSKEGAKAERSKFVQAFDKYTGQESFAKLLRNSAFVQMGDPQGKILEGVIYHVVEDDLYIDFGGKFHTVCLRPQKNGAAYTLGKKVRIVLQDLELSTRFLGAASDLTILEADATLLGLSGERRSSSRARSVSEELIAPSAS